jgi:hypothetical protein
MLCIGGSVLSVVSDHWSRKTVMLVGLMSTTFLTLLIPLGRPLGMRKTW